MAPKGPFCTLSTPPQYSYALNMFDKDRAARAAIVMEDLLVI